MSFGKPHATDTKWGLALQFGSMSVEKPLRNARDNKRVVQQIDCIIFCDWTKVGGLRKTTDTWRDGILFVCFLFVSALRFYAKQNPNWHTQLCTVINEILSWTVTALR